MNFFARRCAAAAVALGVAPCTLAHGPQIQVTRENNKLVTRSIILDGPYSTLTPPRSVYVMPLLEYDGAWYSRPNTAINPVLGLPVYYSGPGLAFGYDQIDGGPQVFESGTNFLLHFTDGLKRWDGGAFVDPGTEQLHAFRGSSPASPAATAATSDAAPFATLAFPPIAADYDAEAHNTARFQLLGDGVDPLSASQDGVYLVSLRLSSSEVGLSASDPFYFVLHKNAAAADVSAAVGSLGIDASLVQVVPEPAALALAATLAIPLVLSAGRRRATRRDVP